MRGRGVLKIVSSLCRYILGIFTHIWTKMRCCATLTAKSGIAVVQTVQRDTFSLRLLWWRRLRSKYWRRFKPSEEPVWRIRSLVSRRRRRCLAVETHRLRCRSSRSWTGLLAKWSNRYSRWICELFIWLGLVSRSFIIFLAFLCSYFYVIFMFLCSGSQFLKFASNLQQEN